MAKFRSITEWVWNNVMEPELFSYGNSLKKIFCFTKLVSDFSEVDQIKIPIYQLLPFIFTWKIFFRFQQGLCQFYIDLQVELIRIYLFFCDDAEDFQISNHFQIWLFFEICSNFWEMYCICNYFQIWNFIFKLLF